ncbi:TcfC E-set like domain-containing protein [Photobacterium damselae]|uniref:TcfC E-set like domain-containing protein n=1 Tax=Photobacterium damselae TaxID=38293 RepID=UPI0010FDCD36|nr:TcfC E-set like domain-containing protein [Photobacterium damselae]KAB1508259.1 hypothetical protein FD717_014895 [Photobacterium damselae subsp. damselae]TLS65367.1 hypothetical protein FD718_20370 [Photobacterium damselae subsp. damselae]
MNRIYHFLLAPCLMGYSLSSSASNNYPLEFADFFENRPETIEVTIAGSSRSEQLKAAVSYDSFQLLPVPNNVQSLAEYLERQKLSSSAIQKIIKALEQGVLANPGCTNSLSSCIPKDIPDQAEFVFDFDNKLLRIFISSDMLKPYNNTQEYYDSSTSNEALINWSNIYLFADENDYTSNFLNNTLIGLPFGYLTVNSQFRNSNTDNDFSVFRALYSAEMNDRRILVGYQDQNALAFNSTDFLNYGANYAGTSLSYGSSHNLLKGDAKAQNRIYFFAPQGGQLEVYQNSRLLLSKVIAMGEQSIGYDELPTGTYTVNLLIKQGSKTVFEEQRQVVNSAQFSLPIGQWDYRLETGILDDNHITSQNKNRYIPEKSKYYGRALTSYRLTESLFLGAGITTNENTSLSILGGSWAINEVATLQYSFGLFSSGGNYQFSQLTAAPFSFSTRVVNHKTLSPSNNLMTLLYGEKNLREYSAGISGNILQGRSFLNYFRYETEDTTNRSVSNNLSLTWSHQLLGGDLSLNSTYSRYDDGRDTWNTGISWRKSLGKSIVSQLGANVDHNGLMSTQDNLSYQYSGESYTGNTTAGLRWYQGESALGEISASVNGQTPFLRYDAYGYLNTSGSRSISTSLSGTQIWSKGRASFTDKQGQSFIELAPYELDSDPTSDPITLNYTALKNDHYWYNDQVNVGTTQLLRLPIYSDIDFDLDIESENVDTKKIDSRFFVTPGSYYLLRNEIIPLNSQIFLLNDMNDKPIKNARCIGSGCKSLELLSENGVFRLNYRSKQPFKLISDKRLCVYNPELMGQKYIQAYCLPGLDSGEQLVKEKNIIPQEKNNQSDSFVYIGKFDTTSIESILSRLNQVGLNAKYFETGSIKYVYIKHIEEYSIAQRLLLDNLTSIAIQDTINSKQLFTTR